MQYAVMVFGAYLIADSINSSPRVANTFSPAEEWGLVLGTIILVTGAVMWMVDRRRK